MSAALAQFCLLKFEPEPKAHTNSIINPTRGIAETIIVIIQSPIDIALFYPWYSFFIVREIKLNNNFCN